MTRVRVVADQDQCCGSGTCAVRVPDVFGQDEATGIVVVLLAEPPPRLHDAVRGAVDNCPSLALRIESEAAG